MRDRLIELMEQADEYTLRRLITDNKEATAAIADYLIENGVIVPPCKVGDTVYTVTQNGEIWWLEVLGAQMTVGINGQGAHWTRWCFVCADAIMFKDEDIGKTIFITHKEAEQALLKP